MIRIKKCHAIVSIVMLLGWAAMPGHAQVLMLVSEAEVVADRAAPHPPITRGRPAPNPNAPRIDVLAPQIAGAPLVTPFAIDVRFNPATGHAINPTTLKIFYGRLGLDITSRILNATPVTAEGLNVPSARVPKGSHRLLLEIHDDADNIGRSEIEFEVSN
jgi:hypothetical protein